MYYQKKKNNRNWTDNQRLDIYVTYSTIHHKLDSSILIINLY